MSDNMSDVPGSNRSDSFEDWRPPREGDAYTHIPPRPPLPSEKAKEQHFPNWLKNDEEHEDQDDHPTIVLPTFEQLTTSPVSDPVKVSESGLVQLTPLPVAEMTSEEIRRVRLELTIHQQKKLMDAKEKPIPPDELRDRFYIWKLILLEMIPVGILLLIYVATIYAISSGMVQGADVGNALLVLLGFTALAVWPVMAIRKVWAVTYIVVNAEQTGVHRPAVRWAFVGERNPSASTSQITNVVPTRNWLLALMRINSWYVSMDSPAEMDEFLHHLHFVRDGDKVKETVFAFQEYNRLASGN